MTTTEVRCPVNPRRLFAKLKRDPDVRIDPSSNTIQVACRDCGRLVGQQVIHAYNVLGEYVGDVTG